jgi:hypothetical protein
MFPLYALPFVFCFVMVNPGFNANDNAIQDAITFPVVPLQKTAADVLAVALMLFRQMFGHPLHGKFCGNQKCQALNNRPCL